MLHASIWPDAYRREYVYAVDSQPYFPVPAPAHDHPHYRLIARSSRMENHVRSDRMRHQR